MSYVVRSVNSVVTMQIILCNAVPEAGYSDPSCHLARRISSSKFIIYIIILKGVYAILHANKQASFGYVEIGALILIIKAANIEAKY